MAGMFERSGRPPEQLHQIQVSVQAEGKLCFVESKESSLYTAQLAANSTPPVEDIISRVNDHAQLSILSVRISLYFSYLMFAIGGSKRLAGILGSKRIKYTDV